MASRASASRLACCLLRTKRRGLPRLSGSVHGSVGGGARSSRRRLRIFHHVAKWRGEHLLGLLAGPEDRRGCRDVTTALSSGTKHVLGAKPPGEPVDAIQPARSAVKLLTFSPFGYATTSPLSGAEMQNSWHVRAR